MIQTHSHSDYSTLDGACTCTQRAQRAVELGQWALALTDHGVLNGIPAHIKACEKVGIQPLLGIEAYYRPDRFVEHSKEEQYNRQHMILIAQDLRGWHNLVRLSSEAFRTGFYQNPCIDDDLLDRFNEGIIMTTSCVAGPLLKSIEMDNGAGTKRWIDAMATRFPGRMFFEIQMHDFDRQRMANIEIVRWARQEGHPLIAGVDSHYDVPGKAYMQKIMALIGTNTTVAEAEAKNRERLARGDEIYELGHEGLHMMSEEDARQRFRDFHPMLTQDVVDEAIQNTEVLAQMTVPYSFNRQLKMPRVVSSQREAYDRIRVWCYERLGELGLSENQLYIDRLEYELDVINKRENSDYIYLIGLIVRWARSKDPLPPTPKDPFPLPKRPMRVGSARGSAAGSLVCYLARITGLDPIAHKLSFERFLNVDRKGLPDIDVDFPSGRRDEVKEYVARFIGRDKVADIAAFGRFTPRAAMKDVARILQLDYNETQKATDLIDPVHDEDLSKLRGAIPQIDAWAKKYPEAWSVAENLENHGDPLIKNVGKHAAGVLIMPTPINDHIPTIRADEDDPTQRTAWSETPRFSIVDEFGLVKADLLSIQGLDQQDMILARVALRTGQEIDLDELPFCRDPNAVEESVMEKFRQGLTLGVNQFEGNDVTAFMRSAQPRNIVDLAAINALYRPGPMGSGGHEHFAKRNTGREGYEIHPLLLDVLGDTFGVLAFQEQVMGLFQVLADYTPSQADNVRKIISKLYREKGDAARQKLDALREEFIVPASMKIGEVDAEAQWLQIPPYSGYSFNRGHASGYSGQAYQDMWLKDHFPADSYAVIMTLEPKKTAAAVRESAQFGLTIAGPDVNLSGVDFTVDYETNTIRYGLQAIKNVGEAAALQIIARAPYASVDEFNLSHSFKYSKCTKRARDALLACGALDSIGGRSDWSESDKAMLESEYLNISLRPGGTFGDDEALIQDCAHSQAELEALQVNDACVVAGVITEVKQLTVKKQGRQFGRQMGRISLRFGLDTFSVTLFPDSWSENILLGTYQPGDDGDQAYAGRACYLLSVVSNGPQWVKFEDGRQLLAHDKEFKPLLEKGQKIIVRGKRDRSGQVIGNAIMGISEFLASQREPALT